MHERQKIAEAHYHRQRMSERQEERKAFEFELSAFLSAARSVLQYAEKEAKTKPKGQQWYAAQMKDPILTFFKKKRDLNIHTEPIQPSAHHDLGLHSRIQVSASATFVVRDQHGNIKQTGGSEPREPVAPPPTPPPTHTITYHFSDWTGTEDVLTLTRQYLDKLTAIVSEGIAQGFITG